MLPMPRIMKNIMSGQANRIAKGMSAVSGTPATASTSATTAAAPT
jgi:hypothetical protein